MHFSHFCNMQSPTPGKSRSRTFPVVTSQLSFHSFHHQTRAVFSYRLTRVPSRESLRNSTLYSVRKTRTSSILLITLYLLIQFQRGFATFSSPYYSRPSQCDRIISRNITNQLCLVGFTVMHQECQGSIQTVLGVRFRDGSSHSPTTKGWYLPETCQMQNFMQII